MDAVSVGVIIIVRHIHSPCHKRSSRNHAMLRGRFRIRFAIRNLKTTREDTALAWKIIQEKVTELA
ncbi:MAG: hypothetical protein ABSA50_04065 [Candidatus Bathyarchaeia archaeon]